MSETIYALASGAGRAGIAIIRVSGPQAGEALVLLTGRSLPEPRMAARRPFADPLTHEPIDDGLALWFPGPASFTGEDVVELHIHGGRAVASGLLDALGRIEGLRMAEPGEFTRRAFLNGKLDLTEVEGLADLIDAETTAQRRQALRQMEGALGALYEEWRRRLIQLLAYLEAEIDFSDDVEGEDPAGRVLPGIDVLRDELQRHLDDGGRGERLRSGIEIAVVGPPNAGKSSLVNRLAAREVAIVSEEAGTTRDLIEVRLDMAGVPVTLIDTAGLRDSENAIEREGVRRAKAKAEGADFAIRLAAIEPDGSILGDFTDTGAGDLKVLNKIDRGGVIPAEDVLAVSVATGQGLEALIAALEARVSVLAHLSDQPLLTRARHREGVTFCVEALGRAGMATRRGLDLELVAEDLRLAARALGRLTGRIDVEDLLDVVFRDFCIGK